MDSDVFRSGPISRSTDATQSVKFALGHVNLDVASDLFSSHVRSDAVYGRDKVDELMRRACLSLASEFGLLARRID